MSNLISVKIGLEEDILNAVNTYKDWHVTFRTKDESLYAALGITNIPGHYASILSTARYQQRVDLYPQPRLMEVEAGPHFVLEISPVSGRVLGLSLMTNYDTWTEDIGIGAPADRIIEGAVYVPLTCAYDETVFFKASGWIEPTVEEHLDLRHKIIVDKNIQLMIIRFLSETTAKDFVRIADCVVVGLNASALVEVQLENVAMSGI